MEDTLVDIPITPPDDVIEKMCRYIYGPTDFRIDTATLIYREIIEHFMTEE